MWTSVGVCFNINDELVLKLTVKAGGWCSLSDAFGKYVVELVQIKEIKLKVCFIYLIKRENECDC